MANDTQRVALLNRLTHDLEVVFLQQEELTKAKERANRTAAEWVESLEVPGLKFWIGFPE